MRLKIVFFILFFLFSIWLKAQILDDTTQNVYGPETTEFILEENIKYETGSYHPLDTSINTNHLFTLLDKEYNKLQNLGNIATAARPVYYTPSETIGRRSGLDAYRYVYRGPDKIKYYDTRSPYTDLEVLFAGNNRTIVNVDYSRNINPNWNAGFDFSRISADKLISVETQGDREVFSTYYDFYTNYQSKNEKYQLLANFSRLNHEVQELGGIDPEDTTYFLYDDSAIKLEDAEGRFFKLNTHLYHQYKVNEQVTFYHDLDWGQEYNEYADLNTTQNQAYYDQILISDDSTINEFKFKEFTNEVGFKGSLLNLFYGIYYKRRNVDFLRRYLDIDGQFTENYGGFFLRLDFDSLHYLLGKGEYLLGGNHQLTANYRNKYFEASYRRINSVVPYIYNNHFGNHHEYYNDFKPEQSDNLYGAINIRTDHFLFRPFVNFSLVNNYIYFDSDREPRQTSGFAQIISPGLKLEWNFLKNLHWHNEAIYTQVTGSSKDVFRFPEVFVNSSLFYKSFWFQRKLEVKTGVNIHFRSGYTGYAYYPVLQQFYLLPNEVYREDEGAIVFREGGYVVADAFFNFKIGQVRLFFKYIHLNQGEQDGFFASPFYTGPPTTLTFGVNWMFFD